MIIHSPLSSQEEVAPLIDAGATEFYCGFFPKEWLKKYSYVNSINARTVKTANFNKIEELEQAVKIASSKNIPVYLTLNSHYYSDKQLKIVRKMIEQAAGIGVDRFIVTDPMLLRELSSSQQGYKTIVSTTAALFNSEALAFFKDSGAERIVLPRHLNISEIHTLAEKSADLNLKLDVFILNTQCPYIDGLCSYQHIIEKSDSFGVYAFGCNAEYDVKAIPKSDNVNPRMIRSAVRKIKAWQGKDNSACGICAIPSLMDIGINAIKIAGRENPPDQKLNDVKIVKNAFENSIKKIPIHGQIMINKDTFQSTYLRRCSMQNCYYPESAERGNSNGVKKIGKSIIHQQK